MLLVGRALGAMGTLAVSLVLLACSRPSPDIAEPALQRRRSESTFKENNASALAPSGPRTEAPDTASPVCQVRVRLTHQREARQPDTESVRDFLAFHPQFEVVEHGRAVGAGEVSFYAAPLVSSSRPLDASSMRALFACCNHVDTCRELNSLYRRGEERDVHGSTIYFLYPDVEEAAVRPEEFEFPSCVDPRVRLSVRRKQDPSDLPSFSEFLKVHSDFVLVRDGEARKSGQLSLYEAYYPWSEPKGNSVPWVGLFARCGDVRTCRRLEVLYSEVRLMRDSYRAHRHCGPLDPAADEMPVAPEELGRLPAHLSRSAACTRIRSCQSSGRERLECEYASSAELRACAAKHDCDGVRACADKLDELIQPRRPTMPRPNKQPPEVIRVY